MSTTSPAIQHPKPRIPPPKTPRPPTISVAINDGGDGRLNAAEVGPPSPSLVPLALLTGKPLPSTSPLYWWHSHQCHRHRQHQQLFRHRPRSLSLADGTLSITADVNDLAGNSASQATESTSKDTTPPTISVAINDGGDGRLNAAEVGSVSISGTTSGVADGQTVSINISCCWRHTHQHHHRQHQQLFRHRPRSLLLADGTPLHHR